MTGARQVGKSTLLKTQFPNYRYVTLDDPFLEEQAKENGDMFLTLNSPPVTYDEVQRAPELFRYIKTACDDTDEKGLFLLSGSQQFKLMKEASDSLSGRVCIVELAGLSMREISGDPFHERFLPTMEYIMSTEQIEFSAHCGKHEEGPQKGHKGSAGSFGGSAPVWTWQAHGKRFPEVLR